MASAPGTLRLEPEPREARWSRSNARIAAMLPLAPGRRRERSLSRSRMYARGEWSTLVPAFSVENIAAEAAADYRSFFTNYQRHVSSSQQVLHQESIIRHGSL